jgi:hypothetical protein
MLNFFVYNTWVMSGIYLIATLLHYGCLTDGMFNISVSAQYLKWRISNVYTIGGVRKFNIPRDVLIR